MVVARPRQFDPDDALRAAMHAFWRKGYDATSLPDLLEATGLSRSSLYETFGGKQQLFEAAVNLYAREVSASLLAHLRTAASAREGLENVFGAQIDACLATDTPGGCLMTNTATALASQDPRIAKLIAGVMRSLGAEFRTLLARGQASGEIDPDKDIDALAHMLVSALTGLNVAARVTPNRRALQAIADGAVAALG